MLIAVTGATGHLGGHLVRALLEAGHTVRTLVRNDTRPLEGLDVVRVAGDVLTPASIRPLVEGAEVVYHLAAHISLVPGEEAAVRAVNVEGTRNVMEACLQAKVRRVIHFSSIHAFEHHPAETYVEDARPLVGEVRDAPTYNRTKAAGERVVREYVARGLDAVVINPSGCMGPLDYKPSAIGQVLLDIYHRRIPALTHGGFNWVDVRDVVKTAIAAERLGKKGEHYLCGGTWMSVGDIAAIIEEVHGVKAPRLMAPMWLLRAVVPALDLYTRVWNAPVRFTSTTLHALEYHQRVDDGRARRELGHTTRPIRETILDSIAWFREAGMIKG